MKNILYYHYYDHYQIITNMSDGVNKNGCSAILAIKYLWLINWVSKH